VPLHKANALTRSLQVAQNGTCLNTFAFAIPTHQAALPRVCGSLDVKQLGLLSCKP
jgi:hypothetical protein